MFNRSGASTIICGDCGRSLVYDYLDELWRHVDNGEEECIDTGRNDPSVDDLAAEAELSRYLDH